MTDGTNNKRFAEKLKELVQLKKNQDKQYDPDNLPPITQPVSEEMYEDPNEEAALPPQLNPREDVIDPSLMQQPSYDDNNIQMLNDIAADESLSVLGYYIGQLSQLGDKAQARLITRATAFQSKNQVFSNIVGTRDYQMAQDDFKYAQILSKADFTAFDMNADYFVSEAIMEAQFNIRLRRSRNALNLQMINTQRTEMAGGHQSEEQHNKIWQKVPFLGGGGR